MLKLKNYIKRYLHELMKKNSEKFLIQTNLFGCLQKNVSPVS
ncbi:unnamed protein product [Schistosoma mattheei]|uniref:Uncharacterized protein n=1 Tax=Schistosoma mattheei TaxID=31246 RepID=A0A183NKA9_9TREM|nr:unnamed protein product [Schistosoma mattheei]